MQHAETPTHPPGRNRDRDPPAPCTAPGTGPSEWQPCQVAVPGCSGCQGLGTHAWDALSRHTKTAETSAPTAPSTCVLTLLPCMTCSSVPWRHRGGRGRAGGPWLLPWGGSGCEILQGEGGRMRPRSLRVLGGPRTATERHRHQQKPKRNEPLGAGRCDNPAPRGCPARRGRCQQGKRAAPEALRSRTARGQPHTR